MSPADYVEPLIVGALSGALLGPLLGYWSLRPSRQRRPAWRFRSDRHQTTGSDMSGSVRYLDALGSLHDMFANYPMRAEMSSIHIAADSAGLASIMVLLPVSDPVVLAAGIVEWRRTLSTGNSWAWRTPCGSEIYVATTGHAPECDEIPIAVLAGPIPHDCYLDYDLDPDTPDELSDDTLYRWLGDEIANNWPFTTASTTDQSSSSVGNQKTGDPS